MYHQVILRSYDYRYTFVAYKPIYQQVILQSHQVSTPARLLLLDVLAKALNLIQNVVHVLKRGSGTAEDHPEEVGVITKRLIANHHCAIVHHAALDQRGNLSWYTRDTLKGSSQQRKNSIT